MKRYVKLATVVGAFALVAAPAMAIASHDNGQGKGHGPHYAPAPPENPGPGAPPPEKAKAYGRYCQDQSKKRVEGDDAKGTPFSQCVTAMAKANRDERMTAR